MNFFLNVLGLIALSLGFLPKITTPPNDDVWKQIVVLQSTRSDVERLLGKSKDEGYYVSYDLEEGHLSIDYAGFNFCRDAEGVGWNVSEWTAVEVTYHLDNPLRFSSLKIDLKRFRKVRESPHSPDMISYINDAKGIAYVVNYEGRLIKIRYFPSSQYDSLRCKASGE
jgi:hypothetical protein